MVHTLRYIKLLPLFICMALPARAAEPALPLDFSGQYDFSMGGITFGTLNIKLNQNATQYDAASDIATAGIIRVFVQHSSHTTSVGKGTDFRYGNVDYESNYQTRKKVKHVKLSKKDGKIVSELVEPPDNRESRPAVAEPKKSAAVDPLALAAVIRVQLANALKSGTKNFSVDYYDGRRLARLHFTLNGEDTIKIGPNVAYPVYSLTGTREPLDGFTKKELNSMKKDPAATLYFTQDKLIPIRVEVPMALGIASATLRM